MNSIDNTTITSLTEIYNGYDVCKLKETLLAQDGFIDLLVPCPSFDSPRWNIDIANDYLAALYVGETLALFCRSLSVHFKGRVGVSFIFHTKMVVTL